MRKYLFAALAASVFILSFYTCKHKPDVIPATPKDTTHTYTGTPCSADSVYFTNTILPLIVSNCAMSGCHDAATHAEGLSLTSYSGIMKTVRAGNASQSKLYRVITDQGGDVMPPSGPLTQSQIDLIYKWILQGAKNNYCDAGSNCDTMNVSFAAGVTPVLNTYCKGCHNSGNASGGVNLDSYSGVLAQVNNGQLMGGLTGRLSPMPKYSLPLSACNLGTIREWIKEGAKNN